MNEKDISSVTVVTEKLEKSSKNSINSSQEESQNFEFQIDPKIEASIRRKLDYRILPAATVIYLMAFVDRANMGNAKNLGMNDALGLGGYNFSISLTAFFITYVLFQIPVNILAKKFGPKISLAGMAFSFGVITMCMGFSTTFVGISVARAILGISQAAIMPAISYMLGTFYRRHELVTRVGIYASFSSLAGAFGGLLATGFSKIPNWGIMDSWRNIFLFEGLITIILSILCYIILPDSPGKASFLTEEEREIAAMRIKMESVSSSDQDKLKFVHFKLAIGNFNTCFTSLGLFAVLLSMNSIALFMPSLISSMGFESLESQLLTVPPYVFGTIYSISICILSDKYKIRGPIMVACAGPLVIIAFAILLTCEGFGPRYFAMFIGTGGAFLGSPLVVAWTVDNSAGPMVRAIASAFNVSFGSLGGLVATWTYLPKDAPKYTTGHAINLAMGVLIMVGCGAASLNCYIENKKRDAGKRDHILEGLTEEEINDLGHNHPNFRFTI